MDLNLFNNKNVKKENFISNFLNELKNVIDKGNKSNIGILDRIQTENKVSTGTKNKMDRTIDEILIEYSNETSDKGALYFIVEKSEKDNTYTTYKYENGDDSVIKLQKSDLPQDAGVDSILRLKNDKYILDGDATNEIKTRITDMANELLEEQKNELEEYRKEGHLYRVSENINGKVFLWDITDKPEEEIEEVDFPEELLSEANEGQVFKYINGRYIISEE